MWTPGQWVATASTLFLRVGGGADGRFKAVLMGARICDSGMRAGVGTQEHPLLILQGECDTNVLVG